MKKLSARSAAVMAAMAALLSVNPAPAGATVPFRVHQHNTHVSATWALDDAHHTMLWLVAYGSTRNQFGGRPQSTGGSLMLQVDQSFCAKAADHWVARSWFASAPASVFVARDSRAASWAPVTVSMKGSQTDIPLRNGACDSPRWRHASSTKLPRADVVVGGDVVAGGHVVTDNTSRREAYPPYRYVTVTVNAARMATDVEVSVSASDRNLRALRSLPQPDFAYVGRTARIELTVTYGRDHRAVQGRSSG